MKETLFSETIKYWDKLSKDERKNALQKLELSHSLAQNRNPRELVFKNLEVGYRGYYNLKNSDFLFIDNEMIETLPSIAIDTVYHEGYHSLIDDYISGRGDLTTIGIEYAQKGFKDTLINRIITHRVATISGFLYSDISHVVEYEERLVRKETALYLLSNFLDMCENKNDCKTVLRNYLQVYGGMLSLDSDNEELSEYIKFNYKKYYNFVANCENLTEFDYSKVPILNKLLPFETVTKAVKLLKSDLYAKAGNIIKMPNISEGQSKFLTQFFSDNLKIVKKRENKLYSVLERLFAQKQIEDNFINSAQTFNLN